MRKICQWILFLFCMMILNLSFCVNAESGSYLIKFQEEYVPDIDKYQLKEINERKGIYEIEDINSIKPIEKYIEYISQNSKIRLIEGTEPKTSLMSDDSDSEQWQLQMVGADAGWELETYGNDIRVAVIDSGCYAHEDLKNNLLEGKNYITGTTDVTDNIGHGTHVSGIIAAELNDIGIVGVAPKAKIVPLKCFDSSHETELGEIIEAIYDAVDVYDCKIINMSWGLKSNDPFLEEAIDYAYDKGVILVASVGNYSSTVMYYPAAYENVIGVSSVNSEKDKSHFAQYNQSVLVTAPGEKVKSTYLNGEYQVLQGTSQAAPMVSGIAAIALSMNQNMTNQEFENLLIDTAEDLGADGYDTKFGYGLVNEKALIDQVQEKIAYYVSPINTRNGEFYVLIRNNSESNLEATSIFGEYQNCKVVQYKQLPLQLLPDDEMFVSIESNENQLKHFLWRSDSGKLVPLTFKRIRNLSVTAVALEEMKVENAQSMEDITIKAIEKTGRVGVSYPAELFLDEEASIVCYNDGWNKDTQDLASNMENVVYLDQLTLSSEGGEFTFVIDKETLENSYTLVMGVESKEEAIIMEVVFSKDDSDQEEEPETAKVTRIAGHDRYLTGIQIANTYKQLLGVRKFETAVVATGTDFADALPGSYLACLNDAPIILTNEKKKNIDLALEYITANVKENGMIYILGGDNAIPEKVENSLKKAGFSVERLYGKSRYETNIEILKAAEVAGGEMIVATGKDFADSLSASATGRPILLVKNKLTDIQKDYLRELEDVKFYIVGGTGAVNEVVEKELEEYGTIEGRIAGQNRRETSVLIAKQFFEEPTAAVTAYAKNFPDGLCGGPLAAKLNAPLLLTTDEKTAEEAAFVKEVGISTGYVLGGTGVLADETVVTVYGLESAKEIIVQKTK